MPDLTQKQRRLLIVLFSAYLVLLVWLILWKFELPWIGDAWMLPRPLKLVPFLPSGDANANDPLEVIANVVFFVPFGMYLCLLTRWRWLVSVALFVAASLALEVTQHLISVGSFDSTDVIANTVGGLAGFWLVRHTLPTAVLTRVMLVGAVVCMVAVALFIASPLHYGPQQRDVVLHAAAHPAAV